MLSFRRKPESSHFNRFWTPAFAGVTELGLFTSSSIINNHLYVIYCQEFCLNSTCRYQIWHFPMCPESSFRLPDAGIPEFVFNSSISVSQHSSIRLFLSSYSYNLRQPAKSADLIFCPLYYLLFQLSFQHSSICRFSSSNFLEAKRKSRYFYRGQPLFLTFCAILYTTIASLPKV